MRNRFQVSCSRWLKDVVLEASVGTIRKRQGRTGGRKHAGLCSVHAGNEVQLCMDLLDFCDTTRKWEGGTSDRC